MVFAASTMQFVEDGQQKLSGSPDCEHLLKFGAPHVDSCLPKIEDGDLAAVDVARKIAASMEYPDVRSRVMVPNVFQ